jgi:endonuclease-3 related protein
LAGLIRPSGYYNVKARRLKAFLDFFFKEYKGNLSLMRLADSRRLRRRLLSVKGIGQETADSILLYALGKPVFVVDAYTKRMLSRHGLTGKKASYEEVQNLFMRNLKKDVKLFNEYHALLVRLGKDFCRKAACRPQGCPLRDFTPCARD